MTQKIKTTESMAKLPEAFKIERANPSGWLVFYKLDASDMWCLVSEIDQNRDYRLCPYPLFRNKDDAFYSAKKSLQGFGGEIKLVKVDL